MAGLSRVDPRTSVRLCVAARAMSSIETEFSADRFARKGVEAFAQGGADAKTWEYSKGVRPKTIRPRIQLQWLSGEQPDDAAARSAGRQRTCERGRSFGEPGC